MAVAIIFILGIVNFALHRAVLESRHPLIGRGVLVRGAAARRVAFGAELFVLIAAMALAASGWMAAGCAYALYSAGQRAVRLDDPDAAVVAMTDTFAMARLFHLSDIHFGLEDRAALAWVADAVAAERPDGVLITGDLTMRARHREFAAAQRWIAGLQAPVTIVVGNHDMPYFNPVERAFAPYRRFRAVERAVARMPAVPGLAVVSLKTAARAQPRANWSKGWVTRRALKTCLTEIGALPDGVQVLVTAHHPLRETGTQGTALTRGGARALEELAQRPVAAVLTGHVHDAFDIVEATPHGSVRMIGAGTLSERTRATPPSYNVLEWDGTVLTATVRTLDD